MSTADTAVTGSSGRPAADRPAWAIRPGTVIMIGSLGLVAGGLLHLGIGTQRLSPPEVLRALVGEPATGFHRQIVVGLRLPRTLIAITAGAMLGLAAAMLQAITRNPLAEPSLLGVSGGAVFAVVLAGTVGLDPGAGSATLLIALMGALLAGALVHHLGWRGRASPTRMVLDGVLVSAVLSAGVSVLLLLDGSAFGVILRWVVGSLHGRVWGDWALLWPWAAVCVALGLGAVRWATALWIGPDIATATGVHAGRARVIIFVVAAALTAGAVSAVGAIGFVGLAGAHVARLLVGAHPARLFVVSLVTGAGLLLAADLVAEGATFSLPGGDIGGRANLPTGAVTALVGGPLLLWLILRRT